MRLYEVQDIPRSCIIHTRFWSIFKGDWGAICSTNPILSALTIWATSNRSPMDVRRGKYLLSLLIPSSLIAWWRRCSSVMGHLWGSEILKKLSGTHQCRIHKAHHPYILHIRIYFEPGLGHCCIYQLVCCRTSGYVHLECPLLPFCDAPDETFLAMIHYYSTLSPCHIFHSHDVWSWNPLPPLLWSDRYNRSVAHHQIDRSLTVV